MKRGGSITKVEVDQNGNPLSSDEALFRKKNVDFTKYSWPEVNPIKYERKDLHSDKMLKLQNYRWPA